MDLTNFDLKDILCFDGEPLKLLYTGTRIFTELKNTKERISNEVSKLFTHLYHVKQFLRDDNSRYFLCPVKDQRQ